ERLARRRTCRFGVQRGRLRAERCSGENPHTSGRGARTARMTTPPRHGIHRAVAKGAGMMIGLRLSDRLIGVASFSILARLLTPEDYGVFALAFSVMTIVALAGDWGFESAVIQRRGFDRGHYDTAWTVRLVAGALVGVLVCVAAAPAARIFAEPRI